MVLSIHASTPAAPSLTLTTEPNSVIPDAPHRIDRTKLSPTSAKPIRNRSRPSGPFSQPRLPASAISRHSIQPTGLQTLADASELQAATHASTSQSHAALTNLTDSELQKQVESLRRGMGTLLNAISKKAATSPLVQNDIKPNSLTITALKSGIKELNKISILSQPIMSQVPSSAVSPITNVADDGEGGETFECEYCGKTLKRLCELK
jgi:hypothetical protein